VFVKSITLAKKSIHGYNIYMRKLKFILISSLFLPTFSYAQDVSLAAKSTGLGDIIVRGINLGLLALAFLGILSMPFAAYFWKKRQEDPSHWIDFFKSPVFVFRIMIIILALLSWLLKLPGFIAKLIGGDSF